METGTEPQPDGAARLAPLSQPLRRIAVFRALHLGDLLCTVPALRALRAAQPDAHIALIGLPWARLFASRYARYVDELIEYPFGEVLPDPADPAAAAFIAAQRRRCFDLALQMHGDGGRSGPLLRALGARCDAGFHPAGAAAPSANWLAWPQALPEVERWLRLIAHLGGGGATQAAALEFPLRETDRETAAGLLAAGGVRQPYVCIHPGAKLHSRRWPLARFAAVANALRADGWPLVITGAAGEAPLAAELHGLLRAPPWGAARPPVLNLCGRTHLGALAAVVDNAALLVCNDTGVSHIAAATGTPSIVISSGGDARRWAPLDRNRHRVLAGNAPCRPCSVDHCPHDHLCARAIGTAEVLALARHQLVERRPHAA